MKGFLLILSLIFSLFLQAQNAEEVGRTWYEPDHFKLQFAGNIGFLSVGAGYLHGNDHLESDLYLGYLPKSIGGDHIISLSAKITYAPWTLPLSHNYSVIPFSTGPYLSYSFGSQFDTFLPNEYPNGYYWWASSLRLGAFIGGSIRKSIKSSSRFSGVALYYELGTYDLKFISFFQNPDYLNITDILSMSLGVKVEF